MCSNVDCGLSAVTKENEKGIRIHEKAEFMPTLPIGPFVRLPDGSIFATAGSHLGERKGGGRLYRSTDEGKTWDEWEVGLEGITIGDTGALLVTRDGTLILAVGNLAPRRWTWDSERHDMPGAILPTVVMRSRDGGRTWSDVQTLHSEWTGATRGMIQTKSGRIVFTTMKSLSNPGRHAVLTYASDDDGRTWQASNLIDFGGCGHHDGMMEASLIELRDGRLLKYIRTNWDCLWQAESTDLGTHWHPYGPVPFPAGSNPPMLTRLSNGSIILAYNDLDPVGGEAVREGGDRERSAAAAKSYRGELSIRFSDDECQSWTEPVVIAHRDTGELCYPFIFEVEDGVLWITTHRFDLAMRLRVADFHL